MSMFCVLLTIGKNFQAVQNYFDENGQYFGYQQEASPRQQAQDRTLDIELKVIFLMIK